MRPLDLHGVGVEPRVRRDLRGVRDRGDGVKVGSRGLPGAVEGNDEDPGAVMVVPVPHFADAGGGAVLTGCRKWHSVLGLGHAE